MGKVSRGALFIPVDGNNVLMIRRRFFIPERNVPERYAGEWTFSGGHVEMGESFCEAAIREFYEETGYTGDVISSSLFMNSSPEIYGRQYDVKFYKGTLSEVPGNFNIGPEVINLRWWDIDEIRGYMVSKEFERELIFDYQFLGLDNPKYGESKMDKRHFPHETYRVLEVLANER